MICDMASMMKYDLNVPLKEYAIIQGVLAIIIQFIVVIHI